MSFIEIAEHILRSLSAVAAKMYELGFTEDTIRLTNNKTDFMIIDGLLVFQPATLTELCQQTDIPKIMLFDSLSKLILKGLVIKESVSGKRKGRPQAFYRPI